MAEVKILYEDKDIIVVMKPAGMASQEERSADMDMVRRRSKVCRISV